MSCFVTQTVPKIFHSHKSHKLRSWNPQTYFTRNISEAVNQISELLFHCDLFLISLIIIFKIYLLTYRDRVQLRPVHTGGEKMNVSLWLCCVKVTPCQIHLQAKNGKWLKAAAWWNPPPAEWGTRKWDFFMNFVIGKSFRSTKWDVGRKKGVVYNPDTQDVRGLSKSNVNKLLIYFLKKVICYSSCYITFEFLCIIAQLTFSHNY